MYTFSNKLREFIFMKKLIISALFLLISVCGLCQQKANACIVSNLDDKMTHTHYGLTIFSNYVDTYDMDFNCNEYIINYIKQKLAYKFNFVELPANIPVMGIAEKFNSYEIQDKSLYLLDSLKNNNIDYVIRIQKVSFNYPLLGNSIYTNWGLFTYGRASFVYAAFSASIIKVNEAKFGPSIRYLPDEDYIMMKEIRAPKHNDDSLTPEVLALIPAPIIRLVNRILDEILPKW
jgi:hypothetical protein